MGQGIITRRGGGAKTATVNFSLSGSVGRATLYVNGTAYSASQTIQSITVNNPTTAVIFYQNYMGAASGYAYLQDSTSHYQVYSIEGNCTLSAN